LMLVIDKRLVLSGDEQLADSSFTSSAFIGFP